MRSSRISPFVLILALLCAAAVTLATSQLGRATRLLNSLEHWSADWRTALLADRAATQHPRIAVILIDEDTVAGLPYRSPIDRAMMARLIGLVSDAGARVIALDFLFDQPTEANKDRELIATIRRNGDRMVLGNVDERVPLRPERREYLQSFVGATGAPTGYLNLRYEIDGVIRGEADPAPSAIAGGAIADSFAAAIAKAAGAQVAAPAVRIAWLKPPADGADTFLILPAAQLLAPANDMERRLTQMLLSSLAGRIVLIGGDLGDHIDRHPTPISKLTGEPMPGVVIHAHSVAQHLDGRRLRPIETWKERVLTFAMALGGFLLGWRFRRNGWVTVTVPVVLLALIGAIFLAGSRTIVPFAEPALAWTTCALLGRAASWTLGRRRRIAYEPS
jgi:adenylate cyclase